MTTEKYLSYFFPFDKIDFVKKGMESSWNTDDVQMMEYLHFHRIPFVVALTKVDKLKKSEMTAQLEEFRITCAPYGCKQVFLTSAEKGTGVEELRQYLDACLAPEA